MHRYWRFWVTSENHCKKPYSILITELFTMTSVVLKVVNRNPSCLSLISGQQQCNELAQYEQTSLHEACWLLTFLLNVFFDLGLFCLCAELQTIKLCYRKDDRAMRPIHGCPEIFGTPWLRAHGYYSQHFYGLLFLSTIRKFLQNLKSVALPVPEIIDGTQTIGQSLDTPTLPFLQNF